MLSATATAAPVPTSAQAVLLTINNIAKFAQVDRRSVERWVSAGLVPGRVRLPSRVARFDAETVLAWLRGKAATVQPLKLAAHA